MLVTDSVTLADAAVDSSGYLNANARTARTGVQMYAGREVGRPDLPVVRVYRDEAEVFSKASLNTFARIPVTVDHPREPVTASNWRALAVGATGEEVLRDGEYLKIGFRIYDKEAIQAVADGKRELSVGYSCALDWAPGTTPDGEPYDARQTDIVANHIAIVDKGRAGAACRLGDTWRAFHPEKSVKMQKLTLDGLTVELEDNAAQIVTKVVADAEAKLKTEKDRADRLAGELAVAQKAVEAKDGEIAAIRSSVMTDAQIEEAAEARSTLIGQAKAFLGDNYDAKGKSNADIRRAAVEKKLGDAAKGMSDAAVEGAFSALAATAKVANPAADMVRCAEPTTDLTDAEAAHSKYVAGLNDHYKGK